MTSLSLYLACYVVVQTVAEEFKVQAMPTFIFMKEGEIKETVVGAAKEEIIANLEKHKTVVAAA